MHPLRPSPLRQIHTTRPLTNTHFRSLPLTVTRAAAHPSLTPVVVVVVVAVTVAMVIVVAGVPVEVETPLRPPEFAGAPVITRGIKPHAYTEIAVVIVAVNIAVTVVMAGARIPVVAPFGMPILTRTPVVAREFAHLGCRDGLPLLHRPIRARSS
jgi:hypothetical protein